MARDNIIYAIYKGDELLAKGLAKECAEILKVTKETIYWYATPQYELRRLRRKNPDNARKCIKLGEAEIVEDIVQIPPKKKVIQVPKKKRAIIVKRKRSNPRADELIEYIKATGSGVIYSQNKQEMDSVLSYLKEAGYKANVITQVDEWEVHFKALKQGMEKEEEIE